MDLGVDFCRVRRGQRIGGKASLRGCLSPSFSDVTEVGEPVHLEDSLEVSTLVPVLFEQGEADIFRALTNTFPRMEREVSCVLNSLASDLLVVFVVEWQNTTKKQIGDDAEGPVVNLFAVGLLKKNLWGDVGEGTERILASLIGADNL